MRKPAFLTRLSGTRTKAVLSLGVILGFGSLSTLAYWTDQATLTGGTFTAGTLDIKLNGQDDFGGAFTTTFAASNMQPGDSKAASVSVQNAGSIDFTYTATGTTTGALAPRLRFTVVAGGTVNGAGTGCTGGTTTFSSGVVASGTPVVPTARPLATGGNESFCVVASLPTSETGGQGTSAQASFSFNAKQVGAP